MRLLRYAGSKDKHTNIVNSYIVNSNSKIYCEPFLGGGSIFINLYKDFDEYRINDISQYLVKIWNSVHKYTWNDFNDFYTQIFNEYGYFKNTTNIIQAKENYYNFRTFYNLNIWNKNNEHEGFYILLLYNSCINSMARWGPNGFNQAAGNRLYLPDKITWTNIHNKLKRTIITNMDFFDFLDTVKDKSLMFLDPPYLQSAMPYSGNMDNDYYTKFQNYVNNSTNEILYTDNDHNDCILDKIIINSKMSNISPNNKIKTAPKQEALFFNIHNKLNLF